MPLHIHPFNFQAIAKSTEMIEAIDQELKESGMTPASITLHQRV